MFKFEHNGEVYQVKFQHIQPLIWKQVQAQKPKVERRPIPKVAKGKKAVTVCTINKVTPEGPVAIAKGVATCFDNDLFIKARGRTISLGRAIKEFGEACDIISGAYYAVQLKAKRISAENMKKS